ncbi:MAG: SPOR domain-containing protein [Candidatus Omnitrophica bacterium]|nr:SPOR domain-containing protein [Candidatus Omnitrophota bacterium]
MNDKQLYLSGLQKNSQKEDKKLILMLSLDKIILSSVVIILLFTLTFSIGVEKGKKIASGNNKHIDKNYINQTSKTISEINKNLDIENKPESLDDNSFLKEIAENTPIKTELSNAQNESIAVQSETEITLNIAKKDITKVSYSIQVASFLKENSALQEADELKKQGYLVSLIKKGKYVVVYVGNYKNEIEAKNRMNLLKKKYKDCILRRL